MYKGKKILAVIPARGGSKGIYLKNIVKLRKKTLIEHLKHTIDRTKYLIDKTIFSSDNDKIINHAKKIGFKVLFKRPKKLSGDNVDVSKVLVHALNFLEQKEKKTFDILLLLEPTCPLRDSKYIFEAIKLLVSKNLDSVWSISEVDNKYHPLKQFIIKKKLLKFYQKKGIKIFARQQLSKTYCRNGAVYAININFLKKYKKIFSAKTGYIVCKKPIISIDTLFDIKFSEWIMKNFK